MKKTILAATLVTFGLGAAAVTAAVAQSADAPSAPAVTWMPMDDVIAKLEAQGYVVTEIEREGTYYEVEMRDANGFEVEAYLDAVSGEPVPYNDDDPENDDD